MQQLNVVMERIAKSFKNIVAFLLNVVGLLRENVILPIIYKSTKCLKKSPRILATVVTVIIVISCTVTVAVATGATTAYAVVYNGETIAAIKEPSVLAEAEILAANKLNNPVCNSELIKINLTETLVSESNLVCSADLADVIIKHSENIVSTAVLKVNGYAVAVGESVSSVKNLIKDCLNDYKTQNGFEKAEFIEDVKAERVYTVKSVVKNLPTVENYFESNKNSLAIKTFKTVIKKEKIAFETINVKSDSLSFGTKKVTRNGVEGSKEVAYEVAMCNGKVISQTEVSSVVITEPVAKTVTVGTKKVIASDSSATATMLWPIERVDNSYVSSYVGDGRSHKGMDIVAPGGTPIYAAEGGTVTFSGWDISGYGYKIIIKHSGGYETVYAHCKALYVKTGDVVARGDNIAAVGTTGRSTGNHLHFEVLKDGAVLNPSNYIGRN